MSSEPQTIRVFVNEQGVSVPRAVTAQEAVAAFNAGEAAELLAGRRRLTDSRGLPIAADTPVHGGAIYRLLPVREPLAMPVEGA